MAKADYATPGDIQFNAWHTQTKRKARNNVYKQPDTLGSWTQIAPDVFSIDGTQIGVESVTWSELFELGLSYRVIGTIERYVAGTLDFNNADNVTTPISGAVDFDIQLDISTDTSLSMDSDALLDADVVIKQIKRVL